MLINKKILAALFLSVTSVAGQNCNLVVPTAPLTATGLATPWKVSTTTGSPAPCSATSFGGSVFVEATIFDTKTNLFSAYFPLVVNDPANAAANPAGTAATAAQAVAVGATGYIGGPAVAPVVPVLTATSIVGIWIGGNNGITTLIATGTGAASSLVTGVCVNGASATDQFGEYAYCNAVAFWTAVNAALAKKAIVVPPLGVTNKGLPCPTVRSFSMVDQDQSDNVLTTQLLVQTVTVNAATGLTTKVLGLQLAQDTVANRAALNLVSAITNASDNRLVSANVVAALGCAPFQVPNLAEVVAGVNQGPLVTTQALSEIMALTYPEATPALVPALDPMVVTTTNGVAAANMNKLNLYRAGVNQAPVTALTQADTAIYCANMVKATPLFLATHYEVLNAAPSLVPAVGSTMLNLLCARFGVSFANLNCATLNPALANPITVTVNRDNVAIANNLLQLFPALTPATLKAQPTPAGGPAADANAGGAAGAADANAGGAAAGADPAATVAPGVANNNANGQNAASLPITTVAAAGGALVGGLVLLFVALMAFGVITCKRRETGVTSRV